MLNIVSQCNSTFFLTSFFLRFPLFNTKVSSRTQRSELMEFYTNHDLHAIKSFRRQYFTNNKKISKGNILGLNTIQIKS